MEERRLLPLEGACSSLQLHSWSAHATHHRCLRGWARLVLQPVNHP